MATFDNSYSRMVAWLKIILPLVALAILSTLFLVSRSVDTTLTIPYSEADLNEITREQKIGNLSYSGVAANGAAITLTAESAQPMLGKKPSMSAKVLQIAIETPNGLKMNAQSPVGIFDSGGQNAELTGGVIITTSSGYIIETDTLNTNLTDSSVSTPGPITATGPLGSISAGQMVLQQQSGNGSRSGYYLVFKNGVSLIYVPQQ